MNTAEKAMTVLKRSILRDLKQVHPRWEEYYQLLRMPQFSLISVYGSQSNKTDRLLQQTLNKHAIVNDAAETVTDLHDSLTLFARRVTTVNSIERSGGYVLSSFPENETQADRFEELTDGINLAVKFVNGATSNIDDTEVTAYYQNRGQLLEFEIIDDEDFDETCSRFIRDLRSKIKL